MRTNSDNYPDIIQDLGNGKYYINFNIEEVEIEGRRSFNYDTIIVDSNDRAELIQALIAFRYSVADELKILYRGTQKEVEEHEEWVTWCKNYIDTATEV